MPVSRGRIAWVRQSSDEGGANLFMTRDRVATLALRGAVAGARLRRRYAADPHWHRHQWLRLRVGMQNLANLHDRIELARHESRYTQLSGGTVTGPHAVRQILTELDKVADPTPSGPDPFNTPRSSANGHPHDEKHFDWYIPTSTQFWSATQEMLKTYGPIATPTDSFSLDVPTPAAALRQVPSI
jgi:hypothetical protein